LAGVGAVEVSSSSGTGDLTADQPTATNPAEYN
jgi:hypothetical protein